jgi:hypothetical protein
MGISLCATLDLMIDRRNGAVFGVGSNVEVMDGSLSPFELADRILQAQPAQ